MLKISEIFEFSSEHSWILKEFWPYTDLKSSNGSVPRRSNLSTQVVAEDLVAAGIDGLQAEEMVWLARLDWPETTEVQS